MEIKIVLRDGIFVKKVRCPQCGVWRDIDDDQYFGRVSMLCDCDWHETINLSLKED
jgi:hypothetical protein